MIGYTCRSFMVSHNCEIDCEQKRSHICQSNSYTCRICKVWHQCEIVCAQLTSQTEYFVTLVAAVVFPTTVISFVNNQGPRYATLYATLVGTVWFFISANTFVLNHVARCAK